MCVTSLPGLMSAVVGGRRGVMLPVACRLLLVALVVVVVVVEAMGKDRDRKSKCADKPCPKGKLSECRYVCHKPGVRPKQECVDVTDIVPKARIGAKENLCGSSGLPLLKMTHGKNRNVYSPYIGECPTADFVEVKVKGKGKGKDKAKGKGKDKAKGKGKGKGKEKDKDKDNICCSQTDKPGQCRLPTSRAESCEGDHECPGYQKCCASTCVDPTFRSIPCEEKICAAGYSCKIEENGARCCPDKSGSCSQEEHSVMCGHNATVDKCEQPCTSDHNCPGRKKCCKCGNCAMCATPSKERPTCDGVICPKERPKCLEQNVVCDSRPCEPVPVCLPEDSHGGQCPTVDDRRTECPKKTCDSDAECGLKQKCCPSHCNSSISVCVKAEDLSSCRIVVCPKKKSCYEVYNLATGNVSAQCLENEPRVNEICDHPLLAMLSKGDLTLLHCGIETNETACPDGFNCIAGEQSSVCCRGDSRPCKPACEPDQECKAAPCEAPTCMNTAPVCASKAYSVCKLPKDHGKCWASTTRYYFDFNSLKCRQFKFYDCGGNKNNFKTLDECKKTCEGKFGCPREPSCEKCQANKRGKITDCDRVNEEHENRCDAGFSCCDADCGSERCCLTPVHLSEI